MLLSFSMFCFIDDGKGTLATVKVLDLRSRGCLVEVERVCGSIRCSGDSLLLFCPQFAGL